MQDDEAILLVGLAILVIGAIIFISVATIADALKTFLLQLGTPQAVAGEFGALVTAGIILFILLFVIRVAFSQ